MVSMAVDKIRAAAACSSGAIFICRGVEGEFNFRSQRCTPEQALQPSRKVTTTALYLRLMLIRHNRP